MTWLARCVLPRPPMPMPCFPGTRRPCWSGCCWTSRYRHPDNLMREDGTMSKTLHLTGDAEADKLLSEDPFALLTAMLLDQQIAMEVAFAGPKKIADRMDGFDVGKIAESDPDEFAEVCVTKPAIHRYG